MYLEVIQEWHLHTICKAPAKNRECNQRQPRDCGDKPDSAAQITKQGRMSRDRNNSWFNGPPRTNEKSSLCSGSPLTIVCAANRRM